MAYAKEIMGAGFSAGQASGVGGQGGTVAAAGSIQGDGTVLAPSINIVTGADGTKGVTLPAAAVGDEAWVYNNAASTLKVWPNVGAGITVTGSGLGTVNASFALLTFKTGVFKMQSATQWFCVVT